jgi:hypothetical protein
MISPSTTRTSGRIATQTISDGTAFGVRETQMQTSSLDASHEEIQTQKS